MAEVLSICRQGASDRARTCPGIVVVVRLTLQVLRGDSRDGRAHCQCLGGPERACPGPHETLGLIPKSPIAFSGRTFERVQTACAGVICALMYVAGTARKSAHFLTPGWSPSQTTPRPRPYRWRTDRRDFVAAGSHYDPLVLSERTHRFYKGHRDLTVKSQI